MTNTGALTGWTYAWTSYQYGDWQATLPASINPSAMFGSLDASMVIVYNGVSYTFEPRRAAISPDQMNAGAITFPGSIILTSLGSKESPTVVFDEATFLFVPEASTGTGMFLGGILMATAYLIRRRLH